MLEVIYTQDKWVVKQPRLTSDDRVERAKWCRDQWGSYWGHWFISDAEINTKFIFYRKDHAEWFVLRWS